MIQATGINENYLNGTLKCLKNLKIWCTTTHLKFLCKTDTSWSDRLGGGTNLGSGSKTCKIFAKLGESSFFHEPIFKNLW